MPRTPRADWSIRVLESRGSKPKTKTKCVCDRPGMQKATGTCFKCGHGYDPWSALGRAIDGRNGSVG